MTDLTFHTPALLFLLLLVPAFATWWIAAQITRSRRLRGLMSESMLQKLAPKGGEWRFIVQVSLLLPALLLLLFSAARPQWGSREERVFQRGRNLVIALDVSRSMLARDVHPSRLERARVDLLDLLEGLRGDRAALVAFRNKGNLICPLTTDRAFLRQAIEGVGIDSAPRGETSVGGGIRAALEAFDTTEAAHNAIVLISDGEDLSGEAAAAAEEAREKGIVIFTVGIGGSAGIEIPDEISGALSYQGSNVVTRLDNETLRQIADITGGRYIPLATAGAAHVTLGNLYRNHLSRIAAQEQLEQLRARRVERYQWFLLPSILLIILAICFSRGRLALRATPKEKITAEPLPAPAAPPPLPNAHRAASGAAAAILLLLAPFAKAETNSVNNVDAKASEAPEGRAAARAAQKLFSNGEYEEAAEAYLSAGRTGTPDALRVYNYNAGIAQLKAGDYDEAAKTFRSLTSDPKAPEEIHAGLGLARVRQAEEVLSTNDVLRALPLMTGGADALREALRHSPDEQQKANLESVLKRLPALRDEARVQRLIKAYGEKQPGELLNKMLTEQRSILVDADTAFTNDTPSQIRQLETLAARQRATEDLWVPLSRKLMEQLSQSVTNQQHLAEIQGLIEATEIRMSKAADALRDLDPVGLDDALRAEAGTYRLWRGMAQPPALIDEAIRRESNSLASVSSPITHPPLQENAEAASLTRQFQQVFPQWIQQMQQQAQADTNVVFEFTEEDRREIERLTAETLTNQDFASEQMQKSGDDGDARGARRKAHESLTRIRELLPDPPRNPNNQQQQQPQNQDQKQQPEPQQQPEMQEPEPNEQEQQEQTPQEVEPEDQTPEDVKELLRRALEREKQHEEEKRRRRNQTRSLPHERDW